ncbi:hypothetical protein ACFE04_002855 [Oxalis oulophora]
MKTAKIIHTQHHVTATSLSLSRRLSLSTTNTTSRHHTFLYHNHSTANTNLIISPTTETHFIPQHLTTAINHRHPRKHYHHALKPHPLSHSRHHCNPSIPCHTHQIKPYSRSRLTNKDREEEKETAVIHKGERSTEDIVDLT